MKEVLFIIIFGIHSVPTIITAIALASFCYADTNMYIISKIFHEIGQNSSNSTII